MFRNGSAWLTFEVLWKLESEADEPWMKPEKYPRIIMILESSFEGANALEQLSLHWIHKAWTLGLERTEERLTLGRKVGA